MYRRKKTKHSKYGINSLKFLDKYTLLYCASQTTAGFTN